MKTFFKIIVAMGVVILCAGCEKPDENEAYTATSLKHDLTSNDHNGSQTLGFNVNLFGTYEYQGPDLTESKCGSFDETGLLLVRNTGVGTGTHFKKVSSYFEFCVMPVAGGGGTYPEGYMLAYFEDEDGDRLEVEVAGQVLPGRLPGMPSFALSYFRDPFFILGGTGKFEGATGEGYTNDYNFIGKDGMVHTSHHWQGTITMNKGK